MSSDKTTVEAIFVKSTKDGFAIPCKIFKAKHREPRAAAFFIHGGCFASGDCDSHPRMVHALTHTLGITIITASFRNGAIAPHRTGTTRSDLKDVTNYFQKKVHLQNNNNKRKIPFGVIGSSSGGYFALELVAIAAQRPASEYPLLFDFCIPICPVAHPGRRASYLKDCISGKAASDPYYGHYCHTPEVGKEMLHRQLSFWETDEAMDAAGELFQKNRLFAADNDGERRTTGTCSSIPPTLLIMGAMDKNVPMHIHQLVQAWATRTIIVGDVGHEIQNEPPASSIDDDETNFKNFLWDMDNFLTTVVAVVKNQNREKDSSSTTRTDDDDDILLWC